MLPFLIGKKERAYQLISHQIPEGKVLQRNHLFVKCSFTNQSSSLKMIDRWNVHMFVRLQISFWNTSSRNTGDWKIATRKLAFGTLAPETLAAGTLPFGTLAQETQATRTLAFGTLAPETLVTGTLTTRTLAI